MSTVVRLVGFATMPCGCVVGRYRDVASTREVLYVEEKGAGCGDPGHRRNHTLHVPRPATRPLALSPPGARAS